MQMITRISDALTTALAQQRIAPSWGADFSGVNPPLDVPAIARAILEEMREPTEAMILAACAKAREEQVRPIAIHRIDAATLWQAMIDAALSMPLAVRDAGWRTRL